MFNKCTVFVCLIAVSLNLQAREITISGVIGNLESKNINTVVRVYNPGYPFYDENPDNEFAVLGSAKYDSATGRYSARFTVPDNLDRLLVSASYRDENTEISHLVGLGSESNLEQIFNLPEKSFSPELAFHFRFLHDGGEFDYSNSYSCILVSDSNSAIGHISLFSFYDAGLIDNAFYDVPPGGYTLACSIKHSESSPPVLRQYLKLDVPLNDITGSVLPESERVVDFIYQGADKNTTSF